MADDKNSYEFRSLAAQKLFDAIFSTKKNKSIKSKMLVVRVTEGELNHLKKEAKEEGVTVSALTRSYLYEILDEAEEVEEVEEVESASAELMVEKLNDPDFLDEIYKPKKREVDQPVANTNPHFERGQD